MAELVRVEPKWACRDCIVAAPGPSLTDAVVHRVRMANLTYGWKVIAVQDAYRALHFADVLYGCNPSWWRHHKNCGGFQGEKWTTHHEDPTNNKLKPHSGFDQALADAYGLNCVEGRHADEFSTDPGYINYGSNSGFQAVNLAILFGSKRIVLVGYDMSHRGGKSHFFGDHPGGELRQNSDVDYRSFVKHYERAAKVLPSDIHIVNATPGSALTCFPIMSLEDALGFRGSPPV